MAFERHAAGDWVMPAKVYVDAPPAGDFRAMPARGEGVATLKWVTSFPANPSRGLPVVAGALLVSSADTGELQAIMDCAAITSLRTGAAAAVSAQVLARDDARSVGLIGCGVNGAWAARCLVAAGYGPGVCTDVRPEAADALAAELGWRLGLTRAGGGRRHRRHRDPRRRARDRRGGPAARSASGGARRRRPRQGRGRARCACALPALLRRVGAGLEGRRALGRGRRRRRGAGRRDRDRRCPARPRRWTRRARRDHALRLDRPRHPGPRHRPRGPRCLARLGGPITAPRSRDERLAPATARA